MRVLGLGLGEVDVVTGHNFEILARNLLAPALLVFAAAASARAKRRIDRSRRANEDRTRGDGGRRLAAGKLMIVTDSTGTVQQLVRRVWVK